ncbi:hypothetical protein [Leifsonia poae]|uniref:hypothetical protein n=1 Tax=Leifsonia poae TaxID=110933 RepID=UPI003D669787
MLADTDSDGFSDGFEVEHADSGLDPVNRNEMLPQVQWLTDFALGAFCGDNNVCRRDSFPWLVGNILSSIAVYGDVRDFVANILEGNIFNAGLVAVGFIPLIGDATGAAAKIVRAMSHLHGEDARAAVRLLLQVMHADDSAFIDVMRQFEPGLIGRLEARGMNDAGMARIIVSNSTDYLKRLLDSSALLAKPPYPHGLPTFMNTGADGERFLREFTGVPQYKHTLIPAPGKGDGVVLGGRFPDAIVTTGLLRHLHEVKVGYVRGIFAFTQLRKDRALLAANTADSVTWHFLASNRTGKIGPSLELLKELERTGTPFYIHFP